MENYVFRQLLVSFLNYICLHNTFYQVLKKILIFALVCILIGVGTGIYLWNMPPKKVENMKGITITATDLAKEYSTNEKAADAKYLNKAIEVSGTINEIDKNQDGGIMVVLETGDPTAGIQCTLRDKGANPVKGQNIVIKGFCSGNGITGVSLTQCVIK